MGRIELILLPVMALLILMAYAVAGLAGAVIWLFCVLVFGSIEFLLGKVEKWQHYSKD